MVAYWEPGTQYNNGDVVQYEGKYYKIIQPHRSQSDWTPNVTPALWGVTHAPENQGQQQWQQQQQPPQQPQYQQQQPQQQSGYGQGQQGGNNDNKTEPQKQDDKHWYEVDDEHKKTFGIVGGILGGLAVAGGAAYAYKQHEKHEDEKKTHQQGYDAWARDAQDRTQQFFARGPQGPYTWVLTHGRTIPRGAIVVSKEHDWLLYICRAYYDGAILLGKASNAFEKGGVLGYCNEEHPIDTYEILLGDMTELEWVRTRGRLNVRNLGLRPVDGGKENDGTPLYIAKAEHKGAEHPGKASEKLDGAYIPYDGKEKKIDDYYVLCHKS
jgi:hypothetical protein